MLRAESNLIYPKHSHKPAHLYDNMTTAPATVYIEESEILDFFFFFFWLLWGLTSCLHRPSQLLSLPDTTEEADSRLHAILSLSSTCSTHAHKHLVPLISIDAREREINIDNQMCMRRPCAAWETPFSHTNTRNHKHTTLLRAIICHLGRNLQSCSLCWRLGLEAFLWKFMSKQLRSHPPVCGPWRQRCPRNYEGHPIHYTPPASSRVCLCACVSHFLRVFVRPSACERFPALAARSQLPNCVWLCARLLALRWFCMRLFDGWAVILQLHASEA